MNDNDKKYQVNLFRPKSTIMKGEVRAILVVIALWGITAFGFQFWLRYSVGTSGKSFLESFTFFNLPFHFWFTAQMLPLCFVIICAVFNIVIDRLSLNQRRKSEGYND